MQPNKSVEEIEELIKYFRGRTGGWGMVLDKSISEIEKDLRKNIQELLTSHTNTVLRGVVERVEKLKQKELEYTKKPSTNTAIRRMMVRRQSRKNTLDEVSSLLNDQIISNEK